MITQPPEDKGTRKAGRPLINEHKAEDPTDEVQGSYSKPPVEKEELSDWEEIPLSQFQKRLWEENRPEVESELSSKQRQRSRKP